MSDESTPLVPEKQKTKPKRRFGCLKRMFIVLLIFAISFWYFCLRITPLRISKETTHITAPLTADGKWVDYFKAFDNVFAHIKKEAPDNEAKEKINERETLYGSKRFWTEKEFPELKGWISESNEVINLLGEAVRKPVFQMPFTGTIDVSDMWCITDSVTFFRKWARAVNGRVKYRIGTGDIDGAIYDIMTIHLQRRENLCRDNR